MSKKVTSRNLAKVMENLTKYALETRDKERWAFCHDLNCFLDELASQDAFGTEGQRDPRGDTRVDGTSADARLTRVQGSQACGSADKGLPTASPLPGDGSQ